jgi:hypothetical protein
MAVMGSVRRDRAIWLCLPVVIAMSVAFGACGSSGKTSAPTTSSAQLSPSTTVRPATDHQTNLAQGETAGIASQLVPVPGYRFVDASKAEIEAALAVQNQQAQANGVPNFFRALSLHSVVGDDPTQNTTQNGREVGFLQLREFNPAPPAGSDEQAAKLSSQGNRQIGRFTVAGTTVYVLEGPSSPDSRYMLAWVRHGVQGVIDGAQRASLEKWVSNYLAIPEYQPNETDQLAAQLKPVAGYVYANWWENTTRSFIDKVFADAVASSAHAVGNSDGTIGGLVLASTGPKTLDELNAKLEAATGATFKATTIAGIPVRTGSVNGVNYYLWVRNGIGGAFTGGQTAADAAFIQKYLAA